MEHDRGQSPAVNGAVGIENFGSKFADGCLECFPARLQDLVAEIVGMNHQASERAEFLADERFSAREAARQSDPNHFW